MNCRGLLRVPKSALPLAMATMMIAGTSIALSSTTAGAANTAATGPSSLVPRVTIGRVNPTPQVYPGARARGR